MWKNLPYFPVKGAKVPKNGQSEQVYRQYQLPYIGPGDTPELIVEQAAIPDPEGNGLLVPPAGIEKQLGTQCLERIIGGQP